MSTQPNLPSPLPAPNLPPPPPGFVETATVKNISHVMKLAALSKDCALIDGPVGVGKTTAVVEAARHIGIEAVYVNMFGCISTLDEMQTIWKAITSTTHPGTAAQIREDIHRHLLAKNLVLIIDDAHRVRCGGLETLLAIWNGIFTRRGEGTTIVFCGNHLEKSMSQKVPELFSRGGTKWTVEPMAGNALVDFLIKWQPGIEGTDPTLLKDINTYHFKGEIRRWRQFFTNLSHLRPGALDGALTQDDVDLVLKFMPKARRG